MPVIVRLGGFHIRKSNIGYIVKDSGLDEVFQLIYPGSETIDHIMSGGAYYKALRAHIFADAAFCSYVLRQYSSQDMS